MTAPTCISFFSARLFQIYCVILAHSFANTTFVLFEVETAFVNICNEGNCLSEVYMDGFILRYLLIILVRIFGGAIFYTCGATRAFILKNIPWLFSQGYLKVSYLPFYTVDFSIGEDLYIWVPADLDQFWCEYSHRAVVGRKGLVQLGHMAANAWPFFNQVDLEPGRGKIKRGLNAADSSTNNHYVSKIGLSKVPTKLLDLLFQQYYFSHFLSPHWPACVIAKPKT